MMIGYPMFRVESLWYASVKPSPPAPTIDALCIEIENGEVLRVPNGGWTKDNPALAVLAYLGVSPSTMEDAEGTHLPVEVYRGDGGPYGYGVPSMVVNNGRSHLERADWFVALDVDDGGAEVEVGGPNGNSGGSPPAL